MHKEKSAFPQSPGIRARSDYIISAHTAEVNQHTTISQELEHLQVWGLYITQQIGPTDRSRSYPTGPSGHHPIAPQATIRTPVRVAAHNIGDVAAFQDHVVST